MRIVDPTDERVPIKRTLDFYLKGRERPPAP